MAKKVIGNIKNHKIVTPNNKATHLELINDNYTIKWGVCKNPYKIKESDKGKIGMLNGRPVYAHNNERVDFKKYAINEYGVIQKRDGSSLHDVVISEDSLEVGYIDLGLPSGKKWASCNLGATSPCEYGDFYAWGETVSKESFSWTTYKYGSLSNLTKYNSTDNKIVLDNTDDAVYVETNGEAHMPTKTDVEELLANTNNSWCTCTILGGNHTSHTVNGRLFVSKTNSTKKIFIPAAGAKNNSSIQESNESFNIWTSSVVLEYKSFSWNLCSDLDNIRSSNSGRFFGCTIRGVKD